ncbi:tumor necrosis factor receptor superfamily member 25 isoform X2 [Trachinotus anak]|uniref:tumor necrosis factor receptor superfamily member 25 isoform X2 n=1 Tax=Trachinotus anak TaxID=443729 RepID=UPI0039F23F07
MNLVVSSPGDNCWLFNFLTVYSSNMAFVLVFQLILAFHSSGQIYTKVTEQTSDSCYKLCPAGYYKIGNCDDPVAKIKCKRCEKDTYTIMENQIEKCRRCDVCNHNEVEIKSCTFNSNVMCDCREGYYYEGSEPSAKYCKQCPCQICEEPHDSPNYTKKCQSCQRRVCLENSDCRRKCTTAISTAISPPTTTTSAPKPSDNGSTPANRTSNPDMQLITDKGHHMFWLFLMVVVLIFMALFGIMLLFIWIYSGKQNSCPCLGTNKGMEPHAEEPQFNEHCSHQDSNPTTLTIKISEESPMMPPNYSPAIPQHPAHIGPLLPNAVHEVVKQDEQSEHWPAIVLYAIIKEVPLRRWKEFLRLLSVADQELERVELEAGLGLGSIERQYQMLRLWSQRSSASLNDVFSALRYMDLSGCAQLLQESLEKLQWRPEQ